VVLVLMRMSHLLGVLQVPLFSPAAGAATTMMAGLSSSGAGDVEPLGWKAHPWSFLSVSSRYGIVCRFTPLLFLLFLL
jgi:hypothetical protein